MPPAVRLLESGELQEPPEESCEQPLHNQHPARHMALSAFVQVPRARSQAPERGCSGEAETWGHHRLRLLSSASVSSVSFCSIWSLMIESTGLLFSHWDTRLGQTLADIKEVTPSHSHSQSWGEPTFCLTQWGAYLQKTILLPKNVHIG